MKTLIAYATKYGSTKICAERLAKEMTGNVSIIELKKNMKIDINDYETIIIGSSIYMGRYLGAVRKFVYKNVDILKKKRLGLFICHMDKETPADDVIANNMPKGIVNKAAVKMGFGGAYKIDKLNKFHRFIFEKVAKTTEDLNDIDDIKIAEFADLIESE